MTTETALTAFAAAMAGAGVGALFALWLRWDTARLARATRPMLGLLVGAALRVAGAVAALWLIGGGEPLRLLAALAGFTLVRMVGARMVGARMAGAHRGSES